MYSGIGKRHDQPTCLFLLHWSTVYMCILPSCLPTRASGAWCPPIIVPADTVCVVHDHAAKRQYPDSNGHYNSSLDLLQCILPCTLCCTTCVYMAPPANQDPTSKVLAVCDAAAAKIGPPVRGAEPLWSCVEALRAAVGNGAGSFERGMATEGLLFSRVSCELL